LRIPNSFSVIMLSKVIMMKPYCYSLFLTGLLIPVVSMAQPTVADSPAGSSVREHVVDYATEFFSRYQPSTALDMVQQLPGFQLDDGDRTRGYGSAAGNILINGRRPSAKQASPSSILARIPANQVERIELIRGQVGGIDMLGQSTLANIILQGDYPAVVRWEGYIRLSNEGPSKPGIDVSLSDSWRGFDYNAGLIVEAEANGESGLRRVYSVEGALIEDSSVGMKSSGIDVIGTLNASTWLGETLVNANTKLLYDTRKPISTLQIAPQLPGSQPRSEIISDDMAFSNIELGIDAIRNLAPDLLGKAIALFFYQELPNISTRRVLNSSGSQTLIRTADTETTTTEGIARLEFNWVGLPDHNVQLNLEGAYNSVDGTLIQTDDTGAGPVIVNVPGANTSVEEVRGDLLLKDTWSFANFELEYGLGSEVSTISQTGDAVQKRSFIFVKPQGTFTYTPGSGQQIRFRGEREISQLNFNDFISSTVFQDDDVILGNPDLRPEATWVTELSYERRFGRISVVKLTGFYHWISNVLDLLPLTGTNAVPGNIGDGRRWGMEFESTFPVDWLGLASSRLSFTARWQDSSVVDPVTGIKRVLSAQGGNPAYRSLMTGNRNNRYFLRLNYRQDFEDARVSWGWTAAVRDERPLFKVNELDLYDEGYGIDAFVETTRWMGLKLRVYGENLLNYDETRDRILFTGRRDLSPIAFREYRSRNSGRKINISVSGSF